MALRISGSYSGLKLAAAAEAGLFPAFCGTTEVVPFPDPSHTSEPTPPRLHDSFREIHSPVVFLQDIKRLLVLSVIRNQSLAIEIILRAGQQAAW